jgi:2-polyprenyl-6-methoxyphenol hydroxylase-like FAD-dependent oxidoreductase
MRDFDVVVVGARCSGAALATFLGHQGVSVLVVDKDTLPGDQVLSTHTIHPPGMDVLDQLGVGDAVRARAPASRIARLAKRGGWVDAPFRDDRAEYCPRRKRLDALLQDAARDAGADLRDRTRLIALTHDADRVTGVRVEHDGREEEIRARLVVGADGRRSTVV